MIIKTLDRDFVEAQTGYRPFTTFYEDFSIADAFGLDAVKDTYNRAFNEWKSNYKYLTELVMVLNWKMAEHYGNKEDYAMLYKKLFYNTQDYAIENLKDDELQYFYRVTD